MARTTPEDMVRLLSSMQGGVPVESPVMGQEGPRRSAETNLGMIQALRQANPVQSPAAPGTITQARRQADEQAKLQREQMAMQERLARLARAGNRGSAPAAPQGLHAVAGTIRAMTEAAIKEGRPFKDLGQTFNNELLLTYFHQHGVKPDDALNLAKSYYGYGLESQDFGKNTLGQLPVMYNAVQQPIPPGTLPHQAPAIDYLKSVFAALQPMKQLPGLREAATQDWANYQNVPEDKKVETGPGTIYRRDDGSTYRYDYNGKLEELNPPTYGFR